MRQWRSRLHLRKALIDERTQWLLRIRSVLYHHGLSARRARPRSPGPAVATSLSRLDLPADARERVTVALGMIDTLERQVSEIERSLRRIARRQAGCQALMTQFGVGELIALTLVTELGDVTRMSNSRKAVRFAGLDIGVHRSDQTARVGKLTRQGSSPLRWALYEAAQSATRHSPDELIRRPYLRGDTSAENEARHDTSLGWSPQRSCPIEPQHPIFAPYRAPELGGGAVDRVCECEIVNGDQTGGSEGGIPLEFLTCRTW